MLACSLDGTKTNATKYLELVRHNIFINYGHRSGVCPTVLSFPVSPSWFRRSSKGSPQRLGCSRAARRSIDACPTRTSRPLVRYVEHLAEPRLSTGSAAPTKAVTVARCGGNISSKGDGDEEATPRTGAMCHELVSGYGTLKLRRTRTVTLLLFVTEQCRERGMAQVL